MPAFQRADLQQLLEQEGESLGNLSQHLWLLGVQWGADFLQDVTSSDPSMRVLSVQAWHESNSTRWEGTAQLYFDGSGEWTFEELVLSELELALRMLWRDPGEYLGDDDYPF